MKKLISIIMTMSLLWQGVAWAVPLNSPQSIVHSPQILDNIYIPEQYGRIDKSMNNEPWTINSPKQPMVVLIKDAHCNYEAQRNIAKILDILIKEYGIDLVGVEGAGGKVDPSVIAGSPDAKKRKEVADKYLKKGWLTASEVLAMEKGKDYGFSIYGVEDLRLYLNDLKAFRDVYSGSGVAEMFIEIAENLVSSLKNKLYAEDVLDFDKKIKEYKENKLPLTELIKYLYSIDNIRFKGYPNLRLVLKAILLEGAIDFNKVEKERSALIRECEKILPKEELEQLVQKSLLYKLGKISSLEYYKYLERQLLLMRHSAFVTIGKKLSLRGVTPTLRRGNDEVISSEIASASPRNDRWSFINLMRFIHLTKLHCNIDENRLFKEIDALIEDIYRRYITDETEWKLHTIDKQIYLLSKLNRLEITRDELNECRQFGLTINNIKEFLKIQGGVNNITIPNELNDENFLKEVDNFYRYPDEFYKYALERDSAIIENLIAKMREKNKDKAVLIAGGFHADGAERLLNEKGIQVVTITPSITKEDPEAKRIYLERMMDSRIQPDKMLSEIRANNLAAPVATAKESPWWESEPYKIEIDTIGNEFLRGVITRSQSAQEAAREAAAKLRGSSGLTKDKWRAAIEGFLQIIKGKQGEEVVVVENILNGVMDGEAHPVRRESTVPSTGDRYQYESNTFSSVLRAIWIRMEAACKTNGIILDEFLRDKSVLILGCGRNVQELIQFAERGTKRIYAVEWDSFAVDFLGKELSKLPKDIRAKITVLNADICSLSQIEELLKDETISFVYSHAVFDITNGFSPSDPGIEGAKDRIASQLNAIARPGMIFAFFPADIWPGGPGEVFKSFNIQYLQELEISKSTGSFVVKIVSRKIESSCPGDTAHIPKKDEEDNAQRGDEGVSVPVKAGPKSPGGLIGKYEMDENTKPVFDPEKGVIIIWVRDIFRPNEPSKEISLRARQVNKQEILEDLKELKGKNEVIDDIICWFETSFNGDLFILEDGANEGILGFGSENMVGLHEVLSDESLMWFHEIAHSAIKNGKTTCKAILSSLDDKGRLWYKKHLAKGFRDNLKEHYAIRALQRMAFPELDRGLSRAIQGILLSGLCISNSPQLNKTREETVVKDGSGREIPVFKNGGVNNDFMGYLRGEFEIDSAYYFEPGDFGVTGKLAEDMANKVKFYLVTDTKGNRYVIHIDLAENKILDVYVHYDQGYFVYIEGIEEIMQKKWDSSKVRKDMVNTSGQYVYTAAFSADDMISMMRNITGNPILNYLYKRIFERYGGLRLRGGLLITPRLDAGGYYSSWLNLILWQGIGAPSNGVLGHETVHHIFHCRNGLYYHDKAHFADKHRRLLRLLRSHPLYGGSKATFSEAEGKGIEKPGFAPTMAESGLWELDGKEAIDESFAYLVEAIINKSTEVFSGSYDYIRYGDIKLLIRTGLFPADYFPFDGLDYFLFGDDEVVSYGFYRLMDELYKARVHGAGKTTEDLLMEIADREFSKEGGLDELLVYAIGDYLRRRNNLGSAEKTFERLLQLGRTDVQIACLVQLGEISRIRGNKDEEEKIHRSLYELLKDFNNLDSFLVFAKTASLSPEFFGQVLSWLDEGKDTKIKDLLKGESIKLEKELDGKVLCDLYETKEKLLFLYKALAMKEEAERLEKEMDELLDKIYEEQSKKSIRDILDERRREEMGEVISPKDNNIPGETIFSILNNKKAGWVKRLLSEIKYIFPLIAVLGILFYPNNALALVKGVSMAIVSTNTIDLIMAGIVVGVIAFSLFADEIFGKRDSRKIGTSLDEIRERLRHLMGEEINGLDENNARFEPINVGQIDTIYPYTNLEPYICDKDSPWDIFMTEDSSDELLEEQGGEIRKIRPGDVLRIRIFRTIGSPIDSLLRVRSITKKSNKFLGGSVMITVECEGDGVFSKGFSLEYGCMKQDDHTYMKPMIYIPGIGKVETQYRLFIERLAKSFPDVNAKNAAGTEINSSLGTSAGPSLDMRRGAKGKQLAIPKGLEGIGRKENTTVPTLYVGGIGIILWLFSGGFIDNPVMSAIICAIGAIFMMIELLWVVLKILKNLAHRFEKTTTPNTPNGFGAEQVDKEIMEEFLRYKKIFDSFLSIFLSRRIKGKAVKEMNKYFIPRGYIILGKNTCSAVDRFRSGSTDLYKIEDSKVVSTVHGDVKVYYVRAVTKSTNRRDDVAIGAVYGLIEPDSAIVFSDQIELIVDKYNKELLERVNKSMISKIIDFMEELFYKLLLRFNRFRTIMSLSFEKKLNRKVEFRNILRTLEDRDFKKLSDDEERVKYLKKSVRIHETEHVIRNYIRINELRRRKGGKVGYEDIIKGTNTDLEEEVAYVCELKTSNLPWVELAHIVGVALSGYGYCWSILERLSGCHGKEDILKWLRDIVSEENELGEVQLRESAERAYKSVDMDWREYYGISEYSASDLSPMASETMQEIVPEGVMASSVAHMVGLKVKNGKPGLWVNGEDISIGDGVERRKGAIRDSEGRLDYKINKKRVYLSNELLKELERSGTDIRWLEEYLIERFRKSPPIKDEIYIDLLSDSEYLFEDHKENGYIGINQKLFEIGDRGTPILSGSLRIKLLKIGIAHELRHECGVGNSQKEEDMLLKEDIRYMRNLNINTEELDILRTIMDGAILLQIAGSELKEEGSIILKEGMPPVVFYKEGKGGKEGKQVVFTREALDELYEMTRLARRIRVELQATCVVGDDGVVNKVYYLRDERRIGIVKTDLPLEVCMNKGHFYGKICSDLAGIRQLLGEEMPGNPTPEEKHEDFMMNLRRLKNHLEKYKTWIELSSLSAEINERTEINSNYVDKFIEKFRSRTWDKIRNSKFARDILNLEALATEFWGNHLLVPLNVPEDKEVIKIHNHPNGCPSPPSAFKDEETGRKWGDIYVEGFMNGVVSGLILSTPDGDELILFYEPDNTNEYKYLDICNQFWHVDRKKALIRLKRLLSMRVRSAGGDSPDMSSNPILHEERNKGLASVMRIRFVPRGAEEEGAIEKNPGRRLTKANRRFLEGKIQDNDLKEKLHHARNPDEEVRRNILSENPYLGENYEQLLDIIQGVPILLVPGRITLYKGGNYAHARRGTYAEDGKLDSSGIWIGEESIRKMEGAEFTLLLLEEAQHILRPSARHGKGVNNIKHSEKLFVKLGRLAKENNEIPSEGSCELDMAGENKSLVVGGVSYSLGQPIFYSGIPAHIIEIGEEERIDPETGQNWGYPVTIQIYKDGKKSVVRTYSKLITGGDISPRDIISQRKTSKGEKLGVGQEVYYKGHEFAKVVILWFGKDKKYFKGGIFDFPALIGIRIDGRTEQKLVPLDMLTTKGIPLLGEDEVPYTKERIRTIFGIKPKEDVALIDIPDPKNYKGDEILLERGDVKVLLAKRIIRQGNYAKRVWAWNIRDKDKLGRLLGIKEIEQLREGKELGDDEVPCFNIVLKQYFILGEKNKHVEKLHRFLASLPQDLSEYTVEEDGVRVTLYRRINIKDEHRRPVWAFKLADIPKMIKIFGLKLKSAGYRQQNRRAPDDIGHLSWVSIITSGIVAFFSFEKMLYAANVVPHIGILVFDPTFILLISLLIIVLYFTYRIIENENPGLFKDMAELLAAEFNEYIKQLHGRVRWLFETYLTGKVYTEQTDDKEQRRNTEQQYHWVRTEYVTEVLNGRAKATPSESSGKPAGIWLSGSDAYGWAEVCEEVSTKGLWDRTPLKAYIDPTVRILEIGTLDGLKRQLEHFRIYYYDDDRGFTKFNMRKFFEKVKKEGYAGIHFSAMGMGDVHETTFFYGWDCESTVIFDPRNVTFERLTDEELRRLGWDRYITGSMGKDTNEDTGIQTIFNEITKTTGNGSADAIYALKGLAAKVRERRSPKGILDINFLIKIINNEKEDTANAFRALSELVEAGLLTEKNIKKVKRLFVKLTRTGYKRSKYGALIALVEAKVINEDNVDTMFSLLLRISRIKYHGHKICEAISFTANAVKDMDKGIRNAILDLSLFIRITKLPNTASKFRAYEDLKYIVRNAEGRDLISKGWLDQDMIFAIVHETMVDEEKSSDYMHRFTPILIKTLKRLLDSGTIGKENIKEVINILMKYDVAKITAMQELAAEGVVTKDNLWGVLNYIREVEADAEYICRILGESAKAHLIATPDNCSKLIKLLKKVLSVKEKYIWSAYLLCLLYSGKTYNEIEKIFQGDNISTEDILRELTQMALIYYAENKAKKGAEIIRDNLDLIVENIYALVLFYKSSESVFKDRDAFSRILKKIIINARINSWLYETWRGNSDFEFENAVIISSSLQQMIMLSVHEIMHNILTDEGVLSDEINGKSVHEFLSDVAAFAVMVSLGDQDSIGEYGKILKFTDSLAKVEEHDSKGREEHQIARAVLQRIFNFIKEINAERARSGKEGISLESHWNDILIIGNNIAHKMIGGKCCEFDKFINDLIGGLIVFLNGIQSSAGESMQDYNGDKEVIGSVITVPGLEPFRVPFISLIGKIYKDLSIVNIEDVGKRKRLGLRGFNTRIQKIDRFSLEIEPLIEAEQGKQKIISSVEGDNKRLVEMFYSLAPEMYKYEQLYEDLFGFASTEHNLIALHKSLANDPIALFHEIGEYLLAKRVISFELAGNELIIYINGKQFGSPILLDNENAMKQARKAETYPDKRNHYLLRAFQRQVFGEMDRGLTSAIRQQQDEAKRRRVVEELAGLLGLEKEEDRRNLEGILNHGETPPELLNTLRELLTKDIKDEDELRSRLQIIFESAEKVVRILNMIKGGLSEDIRANLSKIQEALTIYLAVNEMRRRKKDLEMPKFLKELSSQLKDLASDKGFDPDMISNLIEEIREADGYYAEPGPDGKLKVSPSPYFLQMVDWIGAVFGEELNGSLEKLNRYKYAEAVAKSKFKITTGGVVTSSEQIHSTVVNYLGGRPGSDSAKALSNLVEIIARYVADKEEILDWFSRDELEAVSTGLESLTGRERLYSEIPVLTQTDLSDITGVINSIPETKRGEVHYLDSNGYMAITKAGANGKLDVEITDQTQDKGELAIFMKKLKRDYVLLSKKPRCLISALYGIKQAEAVLDSRLGDKPKWQDDIPLIVEAKTLVGRNVQANSDGTYTIMPNGEGAVWLLKERAVSGVVKILYDGTDKEREATRLWLLEHGVKNIKFITKAEYLDKKDKAVCLLSEDTASELEKSIPVGHRVIKCKVDISSNNRVDSDITDMALASRAAAILSYEKLDENNIKGEFRRLYSAYGLTNEEIDRYIAKIDIREGIALMIGLPPITPFMKVYCDMLKSTKEIVASAA